MAVNQKRHVSHLDSTSRWKNFLLKQLRSQNVPISGDLLKARKFGIHGIRFKTEQGEAGAVDVGKCYC